MIAFKQRQSTENAHFCPHAGALMSFIEIRAEAIK